jgi:hypothetical protein
MSIRYVELDGRGFSSSYIEYGFVLMKFIYYLSSKQIFSVQRPPILLIYLAISSLVGYIPIDLLLNLVKKAVVVRDIVP